MPAPNLPLIESCDGCGLCCQSQSCPPGFAAWFTGRAETVYDEDVQILGTLPPALNDELAAYFAGRNEAAASVATGPCLWFDPSMKQCRHYEHRPVLCREFKLGGSACLQWRETLPSHSSPSGSGDD